MHPVSSSAQVTLLPRLLDWDAPEDRTRFAAALHAGSALGVALAMREDLRRLGAGDVLRAGAASLPAAAVGLALHDVVERRLGTTRGIATGLTLGGAALLWADTRAESRPRGDHGSLGAAGATTRLPRSPDLAAAALAQVVALVPGVSRHGAVLTALRAQGADRASAARTSLLLSLPVAVGAAGLTAVRGRTLPPAGPAVSAAVTAYVATRRARWTAAGTKAAVALRVGMAAAALAHDRRNR